VLEEVHVKSEVSSLKIMKNCATSSDLTDIGPHTSVYMYFLGFEGVLYLTWPKERRWDLPYLHASQKKSSLLVSLRP